TGTTQNWADAWTLGYTPYYTTAVWFGFDRGGSNSLGVNQTGAITAGPVWAQYMKAIHDGLPVREFVRPDGAVEAVVPVRSGLLPPADYTGSTTREVFIAGTQPTEFDRLERFEREQAPMLVDRLRDNLQNAGFSLDASSTNIESQLDLSLELGILDGDEGRGLSGGTRSSARSSSDGGGAERGGSDDDFGANPLLD
ncbi:MAG: penicillin-binding protein, partial [Spirochaetales bacterium]|nr:penicillin-binding protein [Spirochaetales bacterium]